MKGPLAQFSTVQTRHLRDILSQLPEDAWMTPLTTRFLIVTSTNPYRNPRKPLTILGIVDLANEQFQPDLIVDDRFGDLLRLQRNGIEDLP